MYQWMHHFKYIYQRCRVATWFTFMHHYVCFQVRKSLRYLLGNLFGYDHNKLVVPYQLLLPQEKMMLHLLHQLCEKVNRNIIYNYTTYIKNIYEKNE